MKGYIFTYKTKDKNSKTLFHHTLFGRIVSRTYRGRKYSYYKAGMLDNIKFSRLVNSQIFLPSIEGMDFSLLEIFGEMKLEEAERNEEDILLKTGKEYWEMVAKEKGMPLRKLKTKK